jgi:hypothetical protein
MILRYQVGVNHGCLYFHSTLKVSETVCCKCKHGLLSVNRTTKRMSDSCNMEIRKA